MEISKEQFLASVIANRAKDLDAYASRPLRGERIAIAGRDGDVPVILYRAKGSAAASPVFFNMHGGGFMFGDAVLMDSFCDGIRTALGITVVNINYRKAPEHPFPAALHDVYEVVRSVQEYADQYRIDPLRMAVGGHSAGANLAAAVCILAAKRGEFAFKCQVLDYPFLDMVKDPAEKPGSEEADTLAILRLFNECYCKPEQAGDALVSPVCASAEDLERLPPAVFVTAGVDSLCDEAERYACLLMRAGVTVWVKRFANALHGFVEVSTDDYPADPRKSPAQAALAEQARAFINAALAYHLTSP